MFWILMFLIGGFLSAGQFSMGMAQLYPPFAAMLARKGYKDHPDLIPQTQEMILARWRNQLSPGEYKQLMLEAGFNEQVSEMLFQSTVNYLSVYEYITVWRRGEMSEAELDNQLSLMQMDSKQIELAKKASLYYPTPQDIVRFAVREVFTPATVQRYGQDQDLPPDYIPAAKKAGLAEDFAKYYWYAHWQLPSANQGYEMFQREIITQDDLNLLLKSLDYMPFWRGKLEQIQYNVINRVDVRRMYQSGDLTQADVLKQYKHMGYSPEDAQRLTDWTVKNYAPKTVAADTSGQFVFTAQNKLSPSRAMIIEAYQKGIYSVKETEIRLSDLGYTPDAVSLIIKLADDQLKQELIDIEANAITDKYELGTIDLTEYKAELTKLGVSSKYMETIIARELAQYKHRTKLPTKSDLDHWLTKGIIDAATYENRMSLLGYRADDIQLYETEIFYDLQKKQNSSQPASG